MVFKVFAVVHFRYFGALDAPLEPIMAPLGPIWSQTVPKMGPQMAPNRVKMGHLGDHRAQSQEARAILKALVSKMAPRWLKIVSSSPR